MEDIASVPGIKEVVDDALSIAKFIKGHGRVLTMYDRMRSLVKGSTGQKSFPTTRFAYCDMTLEAVVGKDEANIKVMRAMLEDANWWQMVSDIQADLVTKFETTVWSNDLVMKVAQVRKLTQKALVQVG